MVNPGPVIPSEMFGTTLRASGIPEHGSRPLPRVPAGNALRSESLWIGGEAVIWETWTGGVGIQGFCEEMPPQKPVGVASATKPNILGSLSNSPDTQVGGKEKVWGT